MSFSAYKTDIDKAEQFADEALMLAKKENYEAGIAGALHNKGLVFDMRGELDKAMEHYIEALEIYEKLKEETPQAKVLNNIGGIYFTQKNYEKAAHYWIESIKIKEKSGDKKETAKGFINLGAAYTRLKKFDEAQKAHEHALNIFSEINDRENMGNCYNNIGILFHKKEGNGKNAIAWYLKAKNIYEEIKNEGGLLPTLINIGATYSEEKNFSEAVKYLNQSLELAKKLQHRAGIKQAYGNLAETYLNMQDYKNAYKHLERYMEIKDSIMDEKSREQVAQLETKFQTEKKEKEIQRQALELEKSKTRTYLISGAATLLLLFAFLIAWFYRQKKIAKEKLEEAKSRFYSNIVHEFRTPVALITGPIEQALSEIKDEKLKHRLSMPLRNARQILKLVNQLLDISKLESGKMKLNENYGDLKFFTEEIISLFLPKAMEKNISIEFLSEHSSLELLFDPDAAEKMIYNLLSNAVKFTPENGKITVSLSSDENSVFISVKDTGKGIPAGEQKKIFERFYRSKNSDNVQGTGIGLALVKELAELHGGSVSLSSNENGSEFTITLPFKKSAENFSKTQNADIKQSNAETSQVLLVEDNRDMREFVSSLLSEKGFLVHFANDGTEGIVKAKELVPDIIITDVMMPGKNGYEVCEAIKKDSVTDHIPVIMLTAKSAAESRLKGIETGADAYLSKPFNPQELLALVNNFIRLRDKMQEEFSGKPRKKTSVQAAYVSLLKTENVFVKKAIVVIEKHLNDEQFGVEQLSSEMFLSRTQFHRKLKALTGFSANRLIRIVRLEKALELLQSSAGNVTDVAFMTGFGSQPYFTKCFSEHFGFSPSEVAGKA